jgi:SAM-dependent methyltransferase
MSRGGGEGLDPAAVQRSYDRVAGRYADELIDELDGKPLDRALLAVVAEEVERGGGGIVADLGAGPGQVGAFLRAQGPAALALDLSPAMATIARHRLGLPAAAGSLTALPLAGGRLAAATVFYALIHLDDAGLRAAAAEIARVLRPGGVVLAAVHLGDEVRHLDEWWGEPVDVDFRFFAVDDLVELLSGAGLEVEAVVERASNGVEADTRRAYVLARRPGAAADGG